MHPLECNPGEAPEHPHVMCAAHVYIQALQKCLLARLQLRYELVLSFRWLEIRHYSSLFVTEKVQRRTLASGTYPNALL